MILDMEECCLFHHFAPHFHYARVPNKKHINAASHMSTGWVLMASHSHTQHHRINHPSITTQNRNHQLQKNELKEHDEHRVQ